MKKYVWLMFFAALCFTALAHDGGEGDTNECNIHGSESMDAVVILNATSNAPAGAAGIAKIESENEDGSETARIELKTFALDPGTYDLSVALQSTGSNVDLGQFTVTAGGDDEDGNNDDQGEDFFGRFGTNAGFSTNPDWVPGNMGGFTNWGCWTNWNNTNFTCGGTWGKWFDHGDHGGNCTNRPIVTETETDLPAGVNPTDIAEITVSDMNGNPILVGDLVAPSAGTVINISGTVNVQPGPGAPDLTGTAQIQSTATKGKWQHHFLLNASGAAAKTNFKLDVNGHSTGAARSNKSGQMTIKKLPSHVPALRSLRLLDAHGNVAGSAQF